MLYLKRAKEEFNHDSIYLSDVVDEGQNAAPHNQFAIIRKISDAEQSGLLHVEEHLIRADDFNICDGARDR